MTETETDRDREGVGGGGAESEFIFNTQSALAVISGRSTFLDGSVEKASKSLTVETLYM